MKVIHAFPNTRNVGDHFVRHGIERLLRRHVPGIEYSSMPCSEHGSSGGVHGIRESTIDKINQHDLLVIGGSNLYEVNGGKWGVVVEDDALARLRPRTLLIGIGSGWSFAFPELPRLSPRAQAQIGALHERAIGSSVRDEMTARVLRHAGVGDPTVTGCPATFIGDEPPRSLGNGVVGLPFLPLRMFAERSWDPRVWRSPTYQRRRMVTKGFAGVVTGLQAKGHDVRILVHDEKDLSLARQMYGDAARYRSDAEGMLEEIRACSVIVGFRLHACIAALGYGIPSVPILLDGRNAAFVETFGMTEFAVGMDPAMVGSVLQRVEVAMAQPAKQWASVFAKRDQLRERMHSFVTSSLARLA